MSADIRHFIDRAYELDPLLRRGRAHLGLAHGVSEDRQEEPLRTAAEHLEDLAMAAQDLQRDVAEAIRHRQRMRMTR